MKLPRVRVLLPCWLVLVVLASCSAPLTSRPDLCAFVRESAASGSIPLELAQSMYPECSVVKGRP